MRAALLIATVMMACGSAMAADAPVARRYFDWIIANTGQIEKDLPEISRSAEAAARRFVDGHDLGVCGELGLRRELQGRAGGFSFSLKGMEGKPGDVIVYVFGVATAEKPDPGKLIEEQLADAKAASDQGALVIGIASVEQLKALGRLEQVRKACGFLLDNHAGARDGEPGVPTLVVANTTLAWVWTAETFAACTRLGKTPVMNQHERADVGGVRKKTYAGQRWHEDLQVKPIAAGVLGRQYVEELRKVLDAVGSKSWPAIVSASTAMSDTLRQGGKVYVAAFGHAPIVHHGGQLAADPGTFTRLNKTYSYLATPADKDFVLAVASDWEPASDRWVEPERLRAAGRGVAYVIAGYNVKPGDLRPREILIDQQWPPGDSILPVDGYDVKICPASSVVAETILWALTAQVRSDVPAR